jgi:hypothetical protein
MEIARTFDVKIGNRPVVSEDGQPRQRERVIGAVEEFSAETKGHGSTISRTSRNGCVRPASQRSIDSPAGPGMSLASLRRFWTVAARGKSTRAPHGPRSGNRSRSKIFDCANSISTFPLST